ncbi:MAG: gliding motility-associated C-terminal domain-containing protein [Bacteroidetes bacterium]|nr:gliding motility-associated C-terminal domain-containing protein [Bacteroidota bacterium]HET6243270.1 PKD domain-containing protein [Bacteroidia bacterium]
MRLKIVHLTLMACVFAIPVYSQKGKDGNKTINTPNTIVNEFTTLNSNANAGSNNLVVGDVLLNSNGLFSGPLGYGDLLMIIQMQGATLKGNVNDSTWGSIISYNNSGLFEFVQVNSIINNSTINLSCPLQNSYSSNGKVQVIRVPRFSSLTLNNGGELTTPTWNGATGGVMSVEVNGPTAINSGASINVMGRGFRGGGINNTSSIPGLGVYSSFDAKDGGEKGESIGGYQTDYNLIGGYFSRGAPANAGGGGNAHNSGGGGGSNAGILVDYTGNGNPDISNPNWINAWNLEYPGFSNTTSTGGGKGGYTYALKDEDAIYTGPGEVTWEGDNRKNTGGKGGRPLDYSTGRLFLGGGGGSGDANDGCSGAAGAGGGLIYMLCYGTVSGTGQINANGSNGANTFGLGKDAASGAGGGGTVILNASGAINGISIVANGGNGGNQVYNNPNNPFESEGPGGGGGGGYIAISNGNISRIAKGGKNGTTNAAGVSEFIPNGATSGGNGFDNEKIINYNYTILPINDTVCSGNSALLFAKLQGSYPSGTTIFWFDAPVNGQLIGTGNSFSTPVLTQTTTYYLSTCPGLEKATVTAVVIPAPVANFKLQDVCLNDPVYFTDLSTSTGESIVFQEWDFGDGSRLNHSKNPVYTYKSAGTFNVTLNVKTSRGCSSSFSRLVTVHPSPVADFAAIPLKASIFDPVVTFTNKSTDATSWIWNFGDGSSLENVLHPKHRFPSNGPGNYLVQLFVSTDYGCTDTVEKLIEIIPEFTFYAPNTFTPDNDGINDNFFGTGIGIVDYEMWIFDRWGMQVFYTNDREITWDGRVQNGKTNNEIAQQDVYVWMVKLRDVFGKMHEYKGHVTLLK